MVRCHCMLALLVQLALAERPVSRSETSLEVHADLDANATALIEEEGWPWSKKKADDDQNVGQERSYAEQVNVPESCGEGEEQIVVSLQKFAAEFEENPHNCDSYKEAKRSKWQLWKNKADNQDIVNDLSALCKEYHSRWAKAKKATNEFAKYYQQLLETQKYMKNQLKLIETKKEMLK
mmetsp:Transcript_54637/g.101120  ORF Transcript_54637/g.101120 Transcript_54637/m.101120 type:complete len:179 (+) Transcript_54637:75-611(+)